MEDMPRKDRPSVLYGHQPALIQTIIGVQQGHLVTHNFVYFYRSYAVYLCH